jgi:hypothetical protein
MSIGLVDSSFNFPDSTERYERMAKKMDIRASVMKSIIMSQIANAVRKVLDCK